MGLQQLMGMKRIEDNGTRASPGNREATDVPGDLIYQEFRVLVRGTGSRMESLVSYLFIGFMAHKRLKTTDLHLIQTHDNDVHCDRGPVWTCLLKNYIWRNTFKEIHLE